MDNLTLDLSYHDEYLKSIYDMDYDIKGYRRILFCGIPNPDYLKDLFEILSDREIGIVDLRKPPAGLPSNVTYYQTTFEEANISDYEVCILFGIYSWISKEAVRGLQGNVFPKITKKLYFGCIHATSHYFTYRKAYNLIRRQVPDPVKAVEVMRSIAKHDHWSDRGDHRDIDEEFAAHYLLQPDLHGYDPVDLVKEYQGLGWRYHTDDITNLIGKYQSDYFDMCFVR